MTERPKLMERGKESLLDQVACAISWLTYGSGHSLGLRRFDLLHLNRVENEGGTTALREDDFIMHPVRLLDS